MVLKPTGENGAIGYIENITEIDVDEQKWDEVGSKLSLSSNNRGYYLDKTMVKLFLIQPCFIPEMFLQ